MCSLLDPISEAKVNCYSLEAYEIWYRAVFNARGELNRVDCWSSIVWRRTWVWFRARDGTKSYYNLQGHCIFFFFPNTFPSQAS